MDVPTNEDRLNETPSLVNETQNNVYFDHSVSGDIAADMYIDNSSYLSSHSTLKDEYSLLASSYKDEENCSKYGVDNYDANASNYSFCNTAYDEHVVAAGVKDEDTLDKSPYLLQNTKKRWLSMSSSVEEETAMAAVAEHSDSVMPIKKRMMLQMRQTEKLRKRVSLEQYYEKIEKQSSTERVAYDDAAEQYLQELLEEIYNELFDEVIQEWIEAALYNRDSCYELQNKKVKEKDSLKKELSHEERARRRREAKKEAIAKQAARMEERLERRHKRRSRGANSSNLQLEDNELFEEGDNKQKYMDSLDTKDAESSEADRVLPHHSSSASKLVDRKEVKSALKGFTISDEIVNRATVDLKTKKHKASKCDDFEKFISRQEHRMKLREMEKGHHHSKHHSHHQKKHSREIREKIEREAELYDLRKVRRADAYLFGADNSELPLDALRGKKSASVKSNHSSSKSKQHASQSHSSLSLPPATVIAAGHGEAALLNVAAATENDVAISKACVSAVVDLQPRKTAKVAVVRPQAAINSLQASLQQMHEELEARQRALLSEKDVNPSKSVVSVQGKPVLYGTPAVEQPAPQHCYDMQQVPSALISYQNDKFFQNVASIQGKPVHYGTPAVEQPAPQHCYDMQQVPSALISYQKEKSFQNVASIQGKPVHYGTLAVEQHRQYPWQQSVASFPFHQNFNQPSHQLDTARLPSASALPDLSSFKYAATSPEYNFSSLFVQPPLPAEPPPPLPPPPTSPKRSFLGVAGYGQKLNQVRF